MQKPNILVIMVDQLNGTLFPDGPAAWLHAPNLKALARNSTRFENCYTASPLCAPGRAAFMSGQLPSRTGIFDNAAEFPSAIPTFAHYLRREGYQTTLSGKMHFVGPDQLHGFEERLTTDIYPADFGWTPDYRKPGQRIDWWYHNMGSVTGAGVAEITNQMEYDDEVGYHALRKIYDLSRQKDKRPWLLTVSFTHPHDPYVARKKYWDLYADCEYLLPKVEAIPYENQDAHSRRIFDANDWRNFNIREEDIRRSRRAYFANISYLDDKIGELLAALRATRQEANIIFLSDHGDMLGERGLWFKMNFFEGSVRVPLMISSPKMATDHVKTPVSTLDLLPTFCELAGISSDRLSTSVEGKSLVSIANGEICQRSIPMEYAAEASDAPLIALRSDRYKYTFCKLDPEQLFDLEKDPNELHNLAKDPAYKAVLEVFQKEAEMRWDMDKFDADVRYSQAQRWIVYDALRNGAYYPWDFQPLQQASERYMRNHMDLNILEESQRFPRGE